MAKQHEVNEMIDFKKSIDKAKAQGFKIEQIAVLMGVTVPTIYRAMDSGKVQYATGRKLEAWLVENGFAVSSENEQL